MSRDEKYDVAKAGNVGPIKKSEDGSETIGGALSKAGFEPARVGRKIVGQGKRRETLKKRAKDAD